MAAACAVAFWVVRARLEPHPRVTLDTDWIYRPPLRNPLVLGERLLGRGIVRPNPAGVYDENWYRLPVGFAVLAMLTIFALVALLHLATGNV